MLQLPLINLPGQRCTVRTPAISDAHQLSALIRSDEKLRRAIGMNSKPTPEEYLQVIQDWRENKQSLILAIVLNGGTAIGQIALSHIELAGRGCQLGYWLGSEYWNQGIMTEAVDVTLKYARKLRMEKVISTFLKTNVASLKILQKYSPQIEAFSEEKYRCHVLLEVNM